MTEKPRMLNCFRYFNDLQSVQGQSLWSGMSFGLSSLHPGRVSSQFFFPIRDVKALLYPSVSEAGGSIEN